MLTELHSILPAFLAAVLVCIGISRRSDVGKIRLCIFILSITTVNLLTNLFLPGYVSVAVFVLAAAVISKAILHTDNMSAIANAGVISFLYCVLMLFIISAVYVFARDKFLFGMRGYSYIVYSMIFINITCFIVIWLYEKYRNVRNVSEKTLHILKSLDFIVLNPTLFGIAYVSISIIDTIFICICAYIEYNKGDMAFYNGAMFVVAMYSLLMILTVMMLQGLLKNEVDLASKKDEMETLKEYTGTIENLLDEMQKSRHDYKNMILSIQDFVTEKRFDELERYFETEILKSENIEKVSKNIYLSTKRIKMLPLKSLVNAKLNEALSSGINVEITIFNEIDITAVPVLDLCRIMGNLLDNAIDAAKESDEKVISLIMLKSGDLYSITLCNSFKGEIDMAKIWKRGYSTKGKNRGLGLNIVKKMIDNYNSDILLNTEIKNNLFVQDITIPM